MTTLVTASALLAVHVALAQNVPLNLRGVPKSMEIAYAGSSGKFTCLDKSTTIDLSQVNDDFCDCPDGSDEPGTSACGQLNTRGFYCTNKGYRGKYIASIYVNDGVCDCCDGSDEWNNPRAKCANTCDVDGAAWRAQQTEAIRAAEDGAKARLAYSSAGQEASKARAAKIAEATTKLEQAKNARAAAEAAAATVEAEEKAQTDAKRAAISSNAGGAVSERLGLGGLDKEGVVALLSDWVRSSGQAGALEAWLNDQAKAGKLPGVTTDGTWAAKLIDPANPADAVPEVKTPEGDRAREALSTARTDETRAQNEVNTLQEEDKTDFGPDAAFYKLKGSCFDYVEAQYRYSVCPFGRASQDGTNLGQFSGWKASGDGKNPHATMLFTNGQTCWNGPARSIAMTFVCGSEDKVLKVEEPEKCTYAGTMSTPAVCDDRAARELRLSLEEPEPEAAGRRDEL